MEKITEQIVFKHSEVKNRSLLYIQEHMGQTNFIVLFHLMHARKL